ncbi:MAG TPA: SPFH domain-containing protein [Thermoanaerobaculia bacterium]|jgi:regulator of protease activity HflC (stomatin/prohibitin superfamily)
MTPHHRLTILACGLLPLAVTLAGCTPHTTEATEVGVKFNKLTGGIEIMAPGANYFFLPLVNDWKKYDVSLRNLTMTAAVNSGDRQGKDDLRFKTRDGNDIDVDVTVRWRVDPTRVGYLWRNVAPSTDDVQDRLVRPEARAYVRDVLNRLVSEDFYNPTLRFAAANNATTVLGDNLRRHGVIVEQVILGNFTFKTEYQKLINSRKEAEKTAEKLEAEILATREANQANLQSKVAELTETLTRAQGGFEQAKRNADAYLIQRQQGAQAIFAEKTAQAEGIRKERNALNSSAGDVYVNLQLIDALRQKEIRQIPKLPGGNVIIDGNKLLQQLGVTRYEINRQNQAEEPPPGKP